MIPGNYRAPFTGALRFFVYLPLVEPDCVIEKTINTINDVSLGNSVLSRTIRHADKDSPIVGYVIAIRDET